MKTKWNLLMVLVLVATLLGGSAGVARAQGGISGVSPAEGTVGTLVTISGAGFGDKQGKVLLGTETGRVIAWSDTEITFMVDKPQQPDEYAITVLLQGDKQPAETMAFESFSMRRPRITTGELLQDGATITVVGAFFGDKKGELRLGYPGSETGEGIVVEDPKILDWSMNTIRFELPDGLTGQFVLAVRNEVGAGLAMLDLVGGMLGEDAPIPDWGGYAAWENASGIVYNGKLLVFSINYNPGYEDNWRIEMRMFNPADNTFSDWWIPKGETEVPVQPLVVKNPGEEIGKLWMFHTGHRWAEHVCCEPILYTIYDESSGGATWNPYSWKEIPNVSIYEKNTVAPVYDPINHRISVYYEYGHQLRWFYSDDYGASWSDDALVGGMASGGVPLTGGIHAIYWPSPTTTALVAADGMVFAVNNGEYRGYIAGTPADLFRPFLVDEVGEVALLYGEPPMMMELNYGTLTWSEPTQLVELVDTGFILSQHSFSWSPRGVTNYVGNDRHLYAFYGVHHSEEFSESGSSIDKWYMHDETVLAPPPDPIPAIEPTLFKQVSAGEEHACGIKEDGTLVCWGNNNQGQLNHPAGEQFTQISAGDWHTCGVRPDRTVECWGMNNGGQVGNHPTDANYTQVAAGQWHTCAIKTDNSVVCWGADSDTGRAIPPAGSHFTQITAANWHTCGILKDTGYVDCWGDNDKGRMNVPETTAFKQISASDWNTCGIKADNKVVCYGDNGSGQVSKAPTTADFAEVSAANWHVCARKTNGSLACWGSNDDTRVSSMPATGAYTQIEAGVRNTCALGVDGRITCWGNNSQKQSLPPF